MSTPFLNLTNAQILEYFVTSCNDADVSLIKRAAITTLNLNGNTNPLQQEIDEAVCELYRQHKSWDAIIELDSSFYR